jgi:hypothetical protein
MPIELSTSTGTRNQGVTAPAPGHSNTIAGAVALARAAGGDPTIKVEPGLYELGSTITIDIPLDLVGSNVMEIDSGGWPTGVVNSWTETRIVGLAALGALHSFPSAGRMGLL